MTQGIHSRREQKTFGPARIDSWVTFETKDGDPPEIVEAQGIVSCVRDAEGVFQVVLPEATKAAKYQVAYGLEYDFGDFQDPIHLVISDNDPAARTVELTLFTWGEVEGSPALVPTDAPGVTVHVKISTRNY